MRSQDLIGLLAASERLRVVAALVLGADSVTAVADVSGLEPREVGRALRRLEAGGLVSMAGGVPTLHTGLFGQVAREEAQREPPETYEGVEDPAMLTVLRAFVRRGRLIEIPAAAAKRQIVLEYLVASFEPGEKYPEPVVNEMLRGWHPDHAALRRYLVDAGLLTRDCGVYWRTGGRIHRTSPSAQR